eukprot:gnl/TRDRNA2_/TRDRNA2_175457_c0_seq2.p1 gnl/TRDRNA2_/TRDRNA2_175457_c0~~gnl/TRDRNA2_/TRDRNA2_175457_c0_seq2.p1  ORF type:complete len:575 (+),score=63.10 gnl/TRDRNA2_/TRDRNA2_175457_c0_seq2:112-1836(+)
MAEFTHILAVPAESKSDSTAPRKERSFSSSSCKSKILELSKSWQVLGRSFSSSSSKSKIAPEPANPATPTSAQTNSNELLPAGLNVKMHFFNDTAADIDTVVNSKQGLRAWLDSGRGETFVVIVLIVNTCITATLFVHPIGILKKRDVAEESKYMHAAGMRLCQLMFALCWVLSFSISLTMLVLKTCRRNHRIEAAITIYLVCMGVACLGTTIVAVLQDDMLTAMVAFAQVPKCVVCLLRLFFVGTFLVCFNGFSAVDLTVMGAISVAMEAYFWGVTFLCVGTLRSMYSIFLACRSREAHAKADLLIAADERRYNEAWQKIMEQEGAQKAAKTLETVARALQHQIRSSEQKSLDPPLPSLGVTTLGRSLDPSLPSRITSLGRGSPSFFSDTGRDVASRARFLQQLDAESMPIGDLDVLYKQAHALCRPLHRRVQNWAAASDGTSVGPPLKKETRVLQKVMRSYGGDVSRVLDIVRASIVYPGLHDLTVGLRTIIADENVVIKSIKNRFDSTYDASASAGYRDICLILQLIDNETKSAGCHLHMCEVQLHVQSLFSIKNDEGHARYIEWRNLRSE